MAKEISTYIRLQVPAGVSLVFHVFPEVLGYSASRSGNGAVIVHKMYCRDVVVFLVSSAPVVVDFRQDTRRFDGLRLRAIITSFPATRGRMR